VKALRPLRGLLLAGALLWALAPERGRYLPPMLAGDASAERLLRIGTEALQELLRHPEQVPDIPGALSRIQDLALSAAAALPLDPRPWILAGSTRLVAAEPGRAVQLYRKALALGERAEIDVNIGRAFEAQGEMAKSRAAFLRAVWISPALSLALLPDIAHELTPQIHRLDAELKAGRLGSPPELPE